jgi:formamidopyrimidine-DNA glycosylase
MPELPEVEAVCRKLRTVEGARIAAARVFRCASATLPRRIAGRRIHRIERRGKHILIRLDGGFTLDTHLRMSGNLYSIPNHCLHPAAARVIVELHDGRGIILEDNRALARMEAVSSEKLDQRLARQLGPEPLSEQFTVDAFVATARAARQPAKIFLMDQRRVAGLGNIYAAEALFRARIGPCRVIQGISRVRLAKLHSAIVAILNDAVQSACIAYEAPGEFAEAEAFPLAVYDREGEPCWVCGRAIRRIPQRGRSTYYCPRCQA